MFGTEAWFDFAGMSAELLLNVGFAKGALTYLAVWDYPADFVLSNTGALYLTDAQAFVASYAHWFTKEWRTVFTLSAFRTSLDTENFILKTQGTRLQGALEYYPSFVPRRGLLVGIELSFHDDRVTAVDGIARGTTAANIQYSTVLAYTRRRF